MVVLEMKVLVFLGVGNLPEAIHVELADEGA